MGSTMLNKAPSSFITFVYCFLLISFLFNIPLQTVAEGAGRVYRGRSRSLGVNDGASRVGAPPAKPASNAQRSPPKQSSPTQNNPDSVTGKAAVDCKRGMSYRSCLSDPKNKSGESMYNWVEAETPSYNKGGELYPGRH